MVFNIAFVLYPGFEELDFAGPYEAFSAAATMLARDWRIYTVALQRTVRSSHGLSLNVDHLLQDAPKPQLIAVPGGQTTEAMADPALVEYIRRSGERAQWVTSVCTGAFLLHRAGLLSGKRVTTYWAAIEKMRDLPDVRVVDDERWVHDGNVVTAAGVSAGIDMALYVIGQLLTPQAACIIQQYMEYHPAPPYADEPLA